MEKRRLGAGGPEVSVLGVGAMSFAGVYGHTTEAEAHAVLAAALDLGIDHVDTSNVYGMGRSESMIGSFPDKKRFRIATKAAIRSGDGKRWFDNSAAHLTSELEGSLKRLGVETVDLFYVHRRDQEVPIEEVTETLAGLVKAGKTRAIGYSEIAPSSLRRAAAVHAVAAVQSEYSLQTRLPDLGMVQACEALGTALVAFSPVGRALLTDTPPTPETVAASEFMSVNPRFTGANFTANLAATEGLRQLGAEMGTSAAALAIAWLLARSPSVIPIPGTRSVAHLKELVGGGRARAGRGGSGADRRGAAAGLGAWRSLFGGAVGGAGALLLGGVAVGLRGAGYRPRARARGGGSSPRGSAQVARGGVERAEGDGSGGLAALGAVAEPDLQRLAADLEPDRAAGAAAAADAGAVGRMVGPVADDGVIGVVHAASGLPGARRHEERPGGIAAEREEDAAPGGRAGGEFDHGPGDGEGDDEDAHPERAEHRVVGVEKLGHAGRLAAEAAR